MFIDVQLAEPYKNFSDRNIYHGTHIIEPKINGLRGELAGDGIFSREGNRKGFYSEDIKALTETINKLGFNIDGEFENMDTDKNGKLLHHYDRFKKALSILKTKHIHKSRLKNIVFRAFDIIPLNPAHKIPLHKRKELLKKVIPFLQKVSPFAIAETPYYIIRTKEEFNKWFKYFIDMGYEGIILKNLISFYYNNRTEDWLKHKWVWTSDLPILGMEFGTKGKKNEFKMGVLILKTPKGKTEVGTGFNDKGKHNRQWFCDNIKNLIGVVVEIEHEGYANEKGNLRSASFKHLRFDKPKWSMSF